MSDNKGERAFFADEYENNPKRVIKFIDEQEAGVFDVIPQRAKRPDALPEPEAYVPKHVERWNPGKKSKKKFRMRDIELPFSPWRLLFGVMAVSVVAGLGWVFYMVFSVVMNSGL